jgi:DNA invertase Pin-like site-specific DNA recombinase
MRVGYARVSKQEQQSELQIDALQAAGCEKIFVEKASGVQRDRPQLHAALAYMRSGDTFVVWKLDRLARSLPQLIETMAALESKQIAFHSLTETLDTGNVGGKLVFHVFAALAAFERDLIRERTLAGLAAARARGKLGGRPAALSEADLQIAKTLLKDPTIPVSEIAKRLGVSVATLYRHFPGGRGAVLE